LGWVTKVLIVLFLLAYLLLRIVGNGRLGHWRDLLGR
jgi:hypothetical protein